MTDLSCAARLVVARHGEASYVDQRFSDEGGWLSTRGRRQSVELAESVRGLRVARVWSSDTSRAVQTAEMAAGRLGVEAVTRKSLREIDVGALRGEPFSVAAVEAVTSRWYGGDLDVRFADGESGAEVVRRYAHQLNEIADEHRGETVLVIGHQEAMGISLPAIAGNLPPSYAQRHPFGNGESADLALDADGAMLTRWGTRVLEVS